MKKLFITCEKNKKNIYNDKVIKKKRKKKEKILAYPI